MLVKREAKNPIITPADIKPTSSKLKVVGVFNAGATRFDDKHLLLLRVAESPLEKRAGYVPVMAACTNKNQYKVRIRFVRRDNPKYNTKTKYIIWSAEGMRLSHISHLRLARSEDGVNFKIDPAPTLIPEGEIEDGGIEDPRITLIGNTYYITYTAVSLHGAGNALMSTKNFRTFKRHGIIFMPPNKDVTLFPEKFGGAYVAVNRPTKIFGGAEMWISRSNDLHSWGNHRVLLKPRESKWDADRIGGGAIPIKTKKGWLLIYHGVSEKYGYALGAALLDLNNPAKVLARSARAIMVAKAPYEKEGCIPNVVFSCGANASAKGEINLYYGGADTVMCLARTTVAELLHHLKH